MKYRYAFITVIALALIARACTNTVEEENMKQSTYKPKFDIRNYLPAMCPAHQLPFRKVNDQLALAVPPAFGTALTNQCNYGLYDIKNFDKIPVTPRINIWMFMPNLTGFDEVLHKTADQFENDIDRVEVKGLSAVPPESFELGGVGTYPPNVFTRISTGQFPSFDPNVYEEHYGLHCYKETHIDSYDKYTCVGLRDKQRDEYIQMSVSLPPYAAHHVFPYMDVRYYSKRFGGLEIVWQTHASHFKDWQKIDQQLWKHIETWNVSPNPEVLAKVPPAPHSLSFLSN